MGKGKNTRASESVRDENAFLKMKLMLEHGATINEKDPAGDIPPELENLFLKNVVEFEERLRKSETTTVYEHVERPTHFLPVASIPDEEIEDAWAKLQAWLNRYSIDLQFCAPSVTPRELYRFTTEELFGEEIMDMGMPGWNYNFIYDEFHPDPVYESTRAAEDMIKAIFCKEPLDENFFHAGETVQLNLYKALSNETFRRIIARFKDSFDDIILASLRNLNAEVENNCSTVKGQYRVRCYLGSDKVIFSGKFSVRLDMDPSRIWILKDIQVVGIEF